MARNRSLKLAGLSISKTEPELIEQTLAAKDPPAQVLEIGFGEGRVLLELAARFQTARFYGVDAHHFGPEQALGDLRWTATQYDLELPAVLPEVFFYALGMKRRKIDLHFQAESFDLVYSAAVIRFIQDKVRLVEDVCRVLKVGGTAVLALDDSRQLDQTCRIMIQSKRGLEPFVEHFQEAAGDAYRLRVIDPTRLSVEITKLAAEPLDLRLVLDHFVRFMHMPLRDGKSIGGTRSVYRRRRWWRRRSPWSAWTGGS